MLGNKAIYRFVTNKLKDSNSKELSDGFCFSDNTDFWRTANCLAKNLTKITKSKAKKMFPKAFKD